eukprot:scaffold232585_cov77-Attheya_sp.AAC.1
MSATTYRQERGRERMVYQSIKREHQMAHQIKQARERMARDKSDGAWSKREDSALGGAATIP